MLRSALAARLEARTTSMQSLVLRSHQFLHTLLRGSDGLNLVPSGPHPIGRFGTSGMGLAGLRIAKISTLASSDVDSSSSPAWWQ